MFNRNIVDMADGTALKSVTVQILGIDEDSQV